MRCRQRLPGRLCGRNSGHLAPVANLIVRLACGAELGGRQSFRNVPLSALIPGPFLSVGGDQHLRRRNPLGAWCPCPKPCRRVPSVLAVLVPFTQGVC